MPLLLAAELLVPQIMLVHLLLGLCVCVFFFSSSSFVVFGVLFLSRHMESFNLNLLFVHNSFFCSVQILAMWGVLRYYNLLRVGVTWKGPEIIELWYNQCDSSKGSVTTTATQCYHYYVNGSSDNTNGSDDEYDHNDDGGGGDFDGDDDNKQQPHQPSNDDNGHAYSTRVHQSAHSTNKLNSPTDIQHNNKNNNIRNSSGQHCSSTIHKSYMVRRPHRQTVLENFTYNDYGEGTATDNDSISSDVDENDSLLGASEVNFISLVWHKFIYAT